MLENLLRVKNLQLFKLFILQRALFTIFLLPLSRLYYTIGIDKPTREQIIFKTDI